MRDLREVRMAKLRAGVDELDAAGGLRLNGVGGMELAEGRLFIGSVIDGLRRINASKEQQRREREEEEGDNGYAGAGDDDDEDML
jgi:GINS complex subunit 2